MDSESQDSFSVFDEPDISFGMEKKKSPDHGLDPAKVGEDLAETTTDYWYPLPTLLNISLYVDASRTFYSYLFDYNLMEKCESHSP